MIEMGMYFGTGFFLASLGMLIFLPLVHGRAVRLTTRRLEGRIPSSMAEILADKDLLRAQFSISTRRLEVELDHLRTKNASHLVELSKKGDAINGLTRELSALRAEIGPNQDKLAITTAALEQTKREAVARELELSWPKRELADSVALTENQKAVIDALRNEVEGLKQGLDAASNEMKLVVHRHQIAREEDDRVLAQKERELINRAEEVTNWMTVAETRNDQNIALKADLEALRQRVDIATNQLNAPEDHETALKRVLADTEAEVAKRKEELAERASYAENRDSEISHLKCELGMLRNQLGSVAKRLNISEKRRYAMGREAERKSAQREDEMAKQTQELAERSASAEIQLNQLVKLMTEVQTLEDQLNGARIELGALSAQQAAERAAADCKLMEERRKFENFYSRVAELVEQVTLQRAEDKVLVDRAQELQERLDVQSRILEESQAEVVYLGSEVEVFQKAEADLRDAIRKIEECGNLAVRDLTAEKEKVLTALQRANGERVRLVYEVSVLERRLNENWASAQDGGATLNGSMTERGRAA
jgi:chromosome segregation ATPase